MGMAKLEKFIFSPWRNPKYDYYYSYASCPLYNNILPELNSLGKIKVKKNEVYRYEIGFRS